MNRRYQPATVGQSRGTKAAPRPRRAQLGLEQLEDRLVPAAIPTVLNVNSLADAFNPGPGSGVVTLRSAVQAANQTPGPTTINLTVPGTYKITLPSLATDNTAGEFAILGT